MGSAIQYYWTLFVDCMAYFFGGALPEIFSPTVKQELGALLKKWPSSDSPQAGESWSTDTRSLISLNMPKWANLYVLNKCAEAYPMSRPSSGTKAYEVTWRNNVMDCIAKDVGDRKVFAILQQLYCFALTRDFVEKWRATSCTTDAQQDEWRNELCAITDNAPSELEAPADQPPGSFWTLCALRTWAKAKCDEYGVLS